MAGWRPTRPAHVAAAARLARRSLRTASNYRENHNPLERRRRREKQAWGYFRRHQLHDYHDLMKKRLKSVLAGFAKPSTAMCFCRYCSCSRKAHCTNSRRWEARQTYQSRLAARGHVAFFGRRSTQLLKAALLASQLLVSPNNLKEIQEAALARFYVNEAAFLSDH